MRISEDFQAAKIVNQLTNVLRRAGVINCVDSTCMASKVNGWEDIRDIDFTKPLLMTKDEHARLIRELDEAEGEGSVMLFQSVTRLCLEIKFCSTTQRMIMRSSHTGVSILVFIIEKISVIRSTHPLQCDPDFAKCLSQPERFKYERDARFVATEAAIQVYTMKVFCMISSCRR